MKNHVYFIMQRKGGRIPMSGFCWLWSWNPVGWGVKKFRRDGWLLWTDMPRPLIGWEESAAGKEYYPGRITAVYPCCWELVQMQLGHGFPTAEQRSEAGSRRRGSKAAAWICIFSFGRWNFCITLMSNALTWLGLWKGTVLCTAQSSWFYVWYAEWIVKLAARNASPCSIWKYRKENWNKGAVSPRLLTEEVQGSNITTHKTTLRAACELKQVRSHLTYLCFIIVQLESVCAQSFSRRRKREQKESQNLL